MKFTKKLSMHVNGGKAFVTYTYDILADGEPTGILQAQKWEGRPRRLVVNKLTNGVDEFDMISTDGAGAITWLKEQVAKREEERKELQNASIET